MTTTMITDHGLTMLLAWTSPSYPVGAFSYSHGLEAAVEAGQVTNRHTLIDYITAVMSRGGGWTDLVVFAHAHRTVNDPAAFDTISEYAAAFRASSETALESRQMGLSFLSVTRKAYPHPGLDAFAARNGNHPVAHPAIGALACGLHGIPLAPALTAWGHGTAANLVSAGVRLVPLGQTDGQIATAALAPVIALAAARAQDTDLEDLGTSAPLLELASLAHETQYSRLFRS
ncbi:urease accessory protein UreF [Polymorphobacter glacialis]|uniref:Urease accessory protein UreF n=1 Tax=Sandarakinorhabdus glacialis TaxID=1614636 RepID=A0A916ZP47_9SPHN|nr:urease accessory protein UreF [Polymorphobacter glacialis]GGE07308.1 urease accessory protein UreF [Polymorphobacter glacialis]